VSGSIAGVLGDGAESSDFGLVSDCGAAAEDFFAGAFAEDAAEDD
jgi:hypothetical protein